MADGYGYGGYGQYSRGGTGYNPYEHGYYSGQSSAGAQLGHGIGMLFAGIRQRQLQAQQVQGLLDGARRLMITDQSTGKQKTFFTNQQLDPIQRLIDQKNWAAAAQQ